jgi:hypothetical protein
MKSIHCSSTYFVNTFLVDYVTTIYLANLIPSNSPIHWVKTRQDKTRTAELDESIRIVHRSNSGLGLPAVGYY